MYPTQDPVPDLPPQRWAFPVELHLCTLYLSSFRLITVYIPAFSTRGCQLFDRERPCFNDLCIPGAGPVPGLKGSMVNILFANTLKLTNASFTWWRRKWQPTPILLPGKAHGPRSLVGDNPWGRKESDRTEPLRFTHFILLSLEKEVATHSSILAWRIPWTWEPGGLWSMGSRVGHD